MRGAIDLVLIATELAALRGTDVTDDDVALDAARMALSGRIRVHESCQRTPEEIIDELWDAWATTVDVGDDGDSSGKAPASSEATGTTTANGPSTKPQPRSS